jgi:hypothetical protein
MSVPEATVNKNDRPMFPQNYVGLSREASVMNSEPKTERMQEASGF